MKSITLWFGVLACLLVAAQAIQLPNIEEPEEDVLDELADDDNVDVGTLLRQLLEVEENDEDDDDDEEETGRQLAAVDSSGQDRYNAFMDTFLSQLKRQAKRDLEPLKITLTPSKKNKKNGKKNGTLTPAKKDKKNGKKNGRKNSNKNTNKEKNNRKPKEIELPEIVDIEEDLHQIQRREAELEEDVTDRKNKNKKKNNKRSKNKVVLHGLSHIAREGDVKLYNMKNGKTLVTDFTIDNVELDVTRTFGSGEESKAAASATQLKGKMKLKINKEGIPKIKKLQLKAPNAKDITTSGSVARSNSDNSGKGFFKKSVKQVAPTAAKKLLKAAKSIIQSV